jgi:hypothetical protein
MTDLLAYIDPVTSVITTLAACFGVWIAKNNLGTISKNLNLSVENQKLDHLKVVLEIETQMNSRKLEFDKASKSVREADADDVAENKLEIISDYFESAKESYFNSLDRLCFCIDKKYIQDKDWRVEYRNAIQNVITEFPDDFNEASPYKNIKKINRLWQST